MKIQSHFKDYYDYLSIPSHRGDPGLRYVRDQVRPVFGFDVPEELSLWIPSLITTVAGTQVFKGLVVAGRFYVLERLIQESFFIKPAKVLYDWRIYRKVSPKYHIGAVEPRAVVLAKLVNAPIFTVSKTDNRQVVDNAVPNLGSFGFAAILRPETVYQEIYNFIGQDLLVSNEKPVLNRKKLETLAAQRK